MVVKLGVIGCGGVTVTRHLPALARSKRIRVKALCDVDESRLKSTAARFGIAVTYSSAEELIHSPEIDAVAVCVPPSAHADLACAVLQRQKHLYLEKPIAGNLEDAKRILAAAHQSAAVAMIGFNLRSHPLVQQAVWIVSDGQLGSVRLVRSTYTSLTRCNHESPEWRLNRETGGLLQEQAIHHFDLWRYLLKSEVDEVDVRMSSDGIEAVALVRMGNGVLIHAGFSEGATETNELDIFGNEAVLRLSCYEFDGLEVIRRGIHVGSPGRRIRKATSAAVRIPGLLANLKGGGEYVASYRRRWNHFAECIAGTARVDGTLQDACRALEIVLAARESAANGCPTKVRRMEIPPSFSNALG